MSGINEAVRIPDKQDGERLSEEMKVSAVMCWGWTSWRDGKVMCFLRTPCWECFFTCKVWRSVCCSSAWHIQRRFYLILWTFDLGKGFGVCGVSFPLRDSVVMLQGNVKCNCHDSSRHVCVLKSISFRCRWRVKSIIASSRYRFCIIFFYQRLVFDPFSRQFMTLPSFVESNKKNDVPIVFYGPVCSKDRCLVIRGWITSHGISTAKTRWFICWMVIYADMLFPVMNLWRQGGWVARVPDLKSGDPKFMSCSGL